MTDQPLSGSGNAACSVAGQESGLVAAARDWLADCAWADMDPEDFDDVPGWRVIQGVDLHYSGGWRAFTYCYTHPS